MTIIKTGLQVRTIAIDKTITGFTLLLLVASMTYLEVRVTIPLKHLQNIQPMAMLYCFLLFLTVLVSLFFASIIVHLPPIEEDFKDVWNRSAHIPLRLIGFNSLDVMSFLPHI